MLHFTNCASLDGVVKCFTCSQYTKKFIMQECFAYGHEIKVCNVFTRFQYIMYYTSE